MNSSASSPPSKPISVLSALVMGFDRVAAQPAVILPPIVIDLFLWLGPHLRIARIVEQLRTMIAFPEEINPELRTEILRLLTETGEKLNLFSLLTKTPAGIPSMMSGRTPVFLFDLPGLVYARMPVEGPLGRPVMWDLEDAAALLPLWVGMILVGAVLGGMYQVWLSDLVLQRDWKRQERLQAVWRVALFSGLFLGISTLILSLTMVAAVFSTLLLPMFGVIAIFLGFSAIFWIGVYIIFAPHGIISYRLNVVGAIRESFFVVRMNLLSVVGFLTVVLGVAWATGLVWELPPEGTWYLLLAVLGHGFVSSVLWTSSYAYFQGRRDWLAEWREAVLARTQGGEGDSQRPVA